MTDLPKLVEVVGSRERTVRSEFLSARHYQTLCKRLEVQKYLTTLQPKDLDFSSVQQRLQTLEQDLRKSQVDLIIHQDVPMLKQHYGMD